MTKTNFEILTKCIFCNNDLTAKDVVLSSNGFIYCKKCKQPVLNALIQDENHWSRNDNLEKANAIDLLMEGYC